MAVVFTSDGMARTKKNTPRGCRARRSTCTVIPNDGLSGASGFDRVVIRRATTRTPSVENNLIKLLQVTRYCI